MIQTIRLSADAVKRHTQVSSAHLGNLGGIRQRSARI